MIKKVHRAPKTIHRTLACTALALLAGPAMTHGGVHAAGLLAMMAVGLWAAAQNPTARRWLPALLPLAMLLGALAAASGVELAGMES